MTSDRPVQSLTAFVLHRGMRFSCAATLVIALGAINIAAAQNNATGEQHPPAGPSARVIEPYIADHEIAGAVILIGNRDRIIDRETIGYADIAGHRPMKPNDVFWIASMSKAMTACAVMMLVDERKINLDDPIEKYLPEFKGQMVSRVSDSLATDTKPAKEGSGAVKLEPLASPITIRELLSHTSGLAFSSKREPGALDLLPLKSAVESYAAEPLLSHPASKYSYSNEGFNTAGRIVEVVSGMPFEVFLQRRLISPLGMRDTTFWPTDKQLKRLAKSYESGTTSASLREVPIDQLTYPLSDHQHRYAIPAGGLFSTADDVARFCQMMLNKGTFHRKRYLSEESVRLITTKETGSDVTKPYGFGWNIGDGYFEHSGAYKTDMMVDRKRGLIIILMVQHANDWALQDRERLMDSLEQNAIAALGDRIATR